MTVTCKCGVILQGPEVLLVGLTIAQQIQATMEEFTRLSVIILVHMQQHHAGEPFWRDDVAPLTQMAMAAALLDHCTVTDGKVLAAVETVRAQLVERFSPKIESVIAPG